MALAAPAPCGPDRVLTQPRWQGEDLAGKTVLLFPEQGFGDAIQFARYVPLVAARGAKVVVEVQPELKELMTRLPAADQVVALGEPLPAFDFQCPLMSLPLVFDTDFKSIPANVPYLFADAELAEQWARRVSTEEGTRNVGIVWAGRPTHKNDRNRSMDPSFLKPLSGRGTPGSTLFRLARLLRMRSRPGWG